MALFSRFLQPSQSFPTAHYIAEFVHRIEITQFGF